MVNVPIFCRCYTVYKARNITHIKLICKLLIYAGGALKFSEQSLNYAGVLDETIFSSRAWAGGVLRTDSPAVTEL